VVHISTSFHAILFSAVLVVLEKNHWRGCNDRLPFNSFVTWQNWILAVRYFWCVCK